MDILHIAAIVVSYTLALMRLFDTARPLWSVGGYLPASVQPFVIALVAVLPDLATGMSNVKTKQDFANVVLAFAVAFVGSLRGALPASTFKKLPEDARAALARARGTERRRSVPPMPVLFIVGALCIFGGNLFLDDPRAAGARVHQASSVGMLTACSPATMQTVAKVASVALEEILRRSAQASTVIDMVEAKVDGASAVIPPDVLRKVRQGIAAARAANAAALAAANGADQTVAAANAAFRPFRDEWGNLMVLLTEAGLAQSGSLKAAPGEVAIPAPLALVPFEEK
jgi:hypothetical protein